MTGNLFEDNTVYQPLAARMRPIQLSDYIGQEHMLAEGKPLREAVEHGQLHSMVLWGPPGVGKTSLAKLIAEISESHFITLSAVLAKKESGFAVNAITRFPLFFMKGIKACISGEFPLLEIQITASLS